MKVEHFYNYGSYNEIHGNEVVNLSIEGKHVKVNGKDISGVQPDFSTVSFYDIVQHDNPEKLVERLHQLIDGRKGADVGCVLLKCMLDGLIIRKPKQKEFESEFTLIGGWTSIHKYMDDNNENALDRANKIIIF